MFDNFGTKGLYNGATTFSITTLSIMLFSNIIS
jgi:hypothetical protein